MNTTNEMQKKEDELIFNIILSGNIDLIYEALGKDGITASVQLGVLKEDEVAEFYTENKFFEEDNSNIIKIETEDDYYLDENLKNSKELSFENLDILLENLNEENISSILDFLEKEKEKYNNYNLFKDDDLNKLIENAALSNILNKEENISDEIKASNLELREFFIHKYMELTGTTSKRIFHIGRHSRSAPFSSLINSFTLPRTINFLPIKCFSPE